jgi:hypothetical protein
VEPPEFEQFISDLEIGVDRLRSLYEQYFMGIEKIEPQVARKDVDRKIHSLRREQIRNTALRFRFNMLLQRYNTYQTYWQRICREIENGTYKRHMLRAQRRFADGRRSVPPPPAPAPDLPPPPPMAEVERQLDELASDFALPVMNLDDLDLDVDLVDEPMPARFVPSSVPAAAPAPVAAQPPTLQAKTAPVRPVPQQQPQAKPLPVPARPIPPPQARPAALPARPLPPPSAPAPARPPGQPARPAPLAAAPRAPAAAPPPKAVRPAPPAPPAPAPSQPRAPGDLPDERVRQLYSQYVETKRRHNESTAAITYDGVARSLRESSAKLREKHGKTVDFEVQVKDGKTVLKPVLK